MLEYARWKYYLVAVVLAVALLYALPNVFGDDYAIQLVQKSKEPVTETQLASIEQALKAGGIQYKRIAIENKNAMVDRKSTRLNSSHMSISYAVFCLKKKKKKKIE